MIEERARVDSVHDHLVTVTAGAKQGCATCAEGKGCAGGVLGKLANRKDRRVQVSNPHGLHVKPGDWVRIGLDESALVRGALTVYLLPLVAMLVVAAAANLAGAGEGLTTLLAIAALAAGFMLAARLQRKPDAAQRHRPVLLGAGQACSPGPATN
ncbi:SoxR reducing system RseC family protein [bacterium]|nr:SoxR reducing system RseC family protein [bacterium]